MLLWRTWSSLEKGSALWEALSVLQYSSSIISIDLYAATDGVLENFIESSSMITDLEQKYQSVLVAKVKLERDPRTESGLAWSTRDGWPGKISPGTILRIQVIYEVNRPIDLLLPWLRSLIGE